MRIILIALIILVAVGAGFAVLQMTQPPAPPVNTIVKEEPKVEAVNVLVARGPIPVGSIITEQMVDQQPWPKHLVLSGFITSGDESSKVIGMVARSDFQPQEPLSKFKLANPNDANFIAAALPKGKRALTMAVDAISGVAGFIFAGDRVDIILAHKIPVNLSEQKQAFAGGNVRASFSEMVLTNIKVMAVDIRGAGKEEEGKARAPTNITVEVTPEQAQAIRLAENNGSISLALRPLKERGDGASSVTTLGDLTHATIPQNAQGRDVYIIRGVKAEESSIGSTFTTSETPIYNSN